MKLKVANGGAELAVSETNFGAEYNEALVHQVVTAYMAGGRAGTKRQKSRAEVRGGGRKPHAQKGTGQARAGSIRSPIWVGGGRAFAARPRDFTQKVNRKMYRAGMRSMLGQLVRTDRLVVTTEFSVTEPRTKLLVEKLKALVAGQRADRDRGAGRQADAGRAQPAERRRASPSPASTRLSLAAHDKVLMTVGAVKMIEERLQ